MSTTFGSATITLLANGPISAAFVAAPIFDERNLVGRKATDVNLMGYSSEELSLDVYCANPTELGKLLAENGKRHTLTLPGGETRPCALTIQAGGVQRYPSGEAKVACRFKVC